MKTLFLSVAIAVSFITTSWAQKEVECESYINNVTVYLQGAEINSGAKASVPEGETNVVFTGLPSSLNPQTIQLSSTDNIVIMSVSLRINFIAPKREQEEIKKLQDSIDNLNIRLDKIDNRKAVLKGMEDILNNNKKVAGSNVGVNPETLAKVYDYYDEKMTKIENEKLDLKLAEEKLKKTLDEYNSQLKEKNDNSKSTTEVVALVNSKTAAQVTFKLVYLVTDAGWKPEYDIRGENISSPLKLTYKANVWQSTGVDWSDVKMKISSGNPGLTAQGPVFAPWYYNYISNEEVYGKKEDKRKEAAAGYDDIQAKPSSNNTVSYQWKTVNTQLATVYDIDVPYSIPSDSKPHTVVVAEKDMNASYKYYSIPKMDADAFLIARVSDWEGLNLLSADANVFFEGAYVGKSYINANSTIDTLDVSLGRDKKIIIKRVKTKDYDRGVLIGDKIKKSVQYEISVKNTRADKIDIDIIDQVPVSKNSEIEVETGDMGGAVYEKETGKLTWNFKLNPSEEKKVRFSFSVKYLKSKAVYCPKF